MSHRYDHVDFYAYDGDADEMKKVATAYLVGNKVVFEGEQGKRIEKEAKMHPRLEPFIELGGYPFLAELQHIYHGSYFHATGVIRATV